MDDRPIENIKLLLLEQSLEMNEYKKEYNSVPFEVYEFLLETALWLSDTCLKSDDIIDEYHKEIKRLISQ